MAKKVAILGSTGKIGSQALEVIRSYPREFKVIGLACGHKSKKFEQQIKEFKPKVETTAEKDGEKGVVKVATYPEVEMVIVAVVGMAGLVPTLAAIRAGKNIALATKEVLVVAGELVINEVKRHKVKLIPLDSEHSAVFQSLHSGKTSEIRRLILTMGEGPIAKMTKAQLKKVNIRDIFNRPAWSMGQKIAVDSATCMNKVFEIIEAKWLFNVQPEQIEVVVHPEYLCHSLVEFVDGSIITEIGAPDMKRYLQYALFYPQRKKTRVASYVGLVGKKITFKKPPFDKFPCLRLGREALKRGGTMPAVMHGADGIAVDAFIKKQIRFTDTPKIIDRTMKTHRPIKSPSLTQILKAEKWGCDKAESLIKPLRRDKGGK